MLETAFAKLNLALHVRRRRDDGYHELETLFAFVDTGDRLTARAAARDELHVHGEFASQLTDPFGNIVALALAALPRQGGLAIELEKRLPVAAGLGGGSADAGAVFRLVREAHGLPDDWATRAARLGADVPACVESLAAIGRGTGTELEPVDNDWTGKAVLLVNPRQPLATGEVFAAWDGCDRGPIPVGPVSTIARAGRNDLELPAIGLRPVIAEILEELQRSEAEFVRMSGSGATCFALYRSDEAMRESAARLAADRPGWWQLGGNLR